MDKLPQELIDRISRHLSVEDLKQTLTVSRKFQLAAEWYSGAFHTARLIEGESLEKFLDTYSGRRLRYLRHVQFRTSFPALEWDHESRPPCRETVDELRAMDEEFTRQIHSLFTALRMIEDWAEKGQDSRKIDLTIYTPTRVVSSAYCLHRRWVGWRIHLLAPEVLPILASVCSLRIENGGDISHCNDSNISAFKIDLRVLVDLASRLPNLWYLGAKFGGEWTTDCESEILKHFAREWDGPRRDSRHDFAKAVEEVNLPRSLINVNLDFLNPLLDAEIIDQREAMPNLVGSVTNLYDPFSSSLRVISSQLHRLDLRVVADGTLFWPTTGRDANPCWPHLEFLNVMFHIASPSGSWYFQGPKGEGQTPLGFEIAGASYPPLVGNHDDERWDEMKNRRGIYTSIGTAAQFRVVPNDSTIVPFLTGFAKATANMPSLAHAATWAPLRFRAYDVDEAYEDYDGLALCPDGDLAWGIAYTKPGTWAFDTGPGETNSAARQIWWRVAKWRPDDDLHRLFQQIGHFHTNELKEYWEHDIYGDGLVEREMFEELGNLGSRAYGSPS